MSNLEKLGVMLLKVARDETEYNPPKKKAKSLGYSAEWKLW